MVTVLLKVFAKADESPKFRLAYYIYIYIYGRRVSMALEFKGIKCSGVTKVGVTGSGN